MGNVSFQGQFFLSELDVNITAYQERHANNIIIADVS